MRQAGMTRASAATGAVTLKQRFGSALNLNVQFHLLVLDGVYRRSSRVTSNTRISPSIQPRSRRCTACSGRRLPTVSRRAREKARKYSPCKRCRPSRVAESSGFSLHAGLAAKASQRDKLERLARYVSRPPVATGRLALTGSGHVRYTLKTPYRDGTTDVIFEPEDFIARLAALVPKPRAHLIRYHGVFAPASPDRAQIVPSAGAVAERSEAAAIDRHQGMSWAQRLKRVFVIDIETWRQCGGRLRVIASIEEAAVIERILKHLGREAVPVDPAHPGRATPRSDRLV
jgi:hypothetical protein